MKEKREKNNGNTVSLSAAKRILAYIFRYYKGSCLIVAASILISALATLCGTLFMRELIDSYIVQLLNEAAPDFGPLAARLLSLAAVLAAGGTIILPKQAGNGVTFALALRPFAPDWRWQDA